MSLYIEQTLPEPSAEEQQHSLALVDYIRTLMANHDEHITFADYMQAALYAPNLGYYSSGRQKFGKGGDFITAPELSVHFSHCLARQCQQVLASVHEGCILELGAGSGAMVSNILLALEGLDSLPEQYYILEVSAGLRQQQQQCLNERCPHLLPRVHWLDSLENFHLCGVILANEVVDAMPVHLFNIEAQSISERYVTWDKNRFAFVNRSPSSYTLTERIKTLQQEHLHHLPAEGYTSEVNLLQTPWLNSLSHCLEQGLLLIMDYGYSQQDYYHPSRQRGTLMCHYRHLAHEDPLVLPGLQDITTHVDFTRLAEAALNAGLTVNGYITQAYFLLNTGILDINIPDKIDAETFTIQQQIKQLLLPSEMGDRFKVLACSRDLDLELLGFNQHDMRYYL